MSIRKPKYKTLRDLLSIELVTEEDERTAELIKLLRHVKQEKILTKAYLVAICRWKSPRTINLIESNHPATIKSLTKKALTTRSERQKIEYLTKLNGVGIPMASAILTLTNPKRYGVIDIRVWQLLFAINSVQTKPKGIGFTFKNWYHYLKILRYHAKELGVCVRYVERTLFLNHRKLQKGILYGKKVSTDNRSKLSRRLFS